MTLITRTDTSDWNGYDDEIMLGTCAYDFWAVWLVKTVFYDSPGIEPVAHKPIACMVSHKKQFWLFYHSIWVQQDKNYF